MTDVVSNECVKDECRMINCLFASHRVDNSRRLHRTRTSAIDSNVLEVSVVAKIALSHLEVD